MRVSHAQKIQVRRRIHRAQGAIHIEGRDRRREIQPLRKHHLKNVPGGNVFLGPLDRIDKPLPAGAGVHLQLALGRTRGFVPVRRAQSRSQLSFQHGDVRGGAIVSLARTFARHIGRGDDVDLVAQVIEGQQPVEEHQDAIGQREIILGVFADVFQLPHRVIREVAHRARRKRRQPGHGRGTMLPQQFLDDLDRAALALLRLLAALDHDVLAPRPHLHVGTRSQKRVAADLLAPLHRLEQKGIGLIGCDGEEGGDRRQQIGGNRFHHRHQRGFSGQPGKFLVIGTKHGLQSF